jgi:hypothetical protein
MMDTELDIFERVDDGSVCWRACVKGRDEASEFLSQMAKQTPNECFAMHLPTKEVVARVNGTQSQSA